MREKLIELLKNLPQVNHFEAQVHGLDYVFGCAADHLIANDVVPVVRCEDCKYRIETSASSTKIACTKGVNWRAVEQNHFCSYGERKDDDCK